MHLQKYLQCKKHIDRWKFKASSKEEKGRSREPGKSGIERREEARIKEAKSPKATATTDGVRVKERHHNRRRGRVQLMIPPIASCSCLWAGSYKVPAVAAACFPRA